MSGGSFGTFEFLAAAPDERRIAEQQANDKLAAAVYDVCEEFGNFLFSAADIREFRSRVALVRPDMIKVIDRHLMPVSGVMGRIALRRGCILEREFKARQAVRKGAPSAGGEDDGRLHGPFAGYDNWEDCTSQNSDKGDSDAYCGQIYHQVEDGRKDKGEPLTDFQDKESRRRVAAVDRQARFLPVISAQGIEAYYPPQTIDDLVETRSPQERLDEHHRNQRREGEEPAQSLHVTTQRRRATGDGPPLNTDETFSDHQDQALIPEGDFKGYLDSVDQGAPGKVDGNFVNNPDAQEHTEDPAKTDFVARRARRVFAQFLRFCQRNKLPLTLKTLERHGNKLGPVDYLIVASGLDTYGRVRSAGLAAHIIRVAEASAWDYDDYGARTPEQDAPSTSPHHDIEEPAFHGRPGDMPKKPKEPDYFHPGKYPYARKTAAPDYLQKATEALTQFLNQCAEQFQTEIQPMQQALQVCQQAQALAQQANPLNVMPPAGTVNVLPEPPAGLAQSPAGAAPTDQGAPPPAAAAAGGLPADPTQQAPDPTAAPDPADQMLATRGYRRANGEYPSDDPAQHYADWHAFQGLDLAEHPKHLREYAHETAASPQEIARIRQVHGTKRGGHPKGRRPV